MSESWFAARRAVLRYALASVAAASVSGAAAQATPPNKRVLLVVGDSLSAEYGLVRDAGWVKLLEQRLTRQGLDQYIVVNASISGETTSGGRTRLPALLQSHRPAVVVLELGANDGLRGLPVDLTRANLRAMVEASQAAGARVLLVGIRVPPNYGRDYAERFFATFGEVARETRAALTPFLLEGFADDMSLFQADRIHPNEKAQARMLDNVWPRLRPLLVARK
ncbi:MAG: arylesterase [Burkholderiaceae bacterium]|nr:arylesterase [Burkholderiaceae bacterium]